MADVLVVDDERNIREHLAVHLRSLGHEVRIAVDGKSALAAAAKRSPDVVFSDVRMAGMDGLRLLGALLERAPAPIVVLMTAYATIAQAVEAIRGGAYDYLAKPFTLDQVTLVLERALEIRHLRRENRDLRRALDEPEEPSSVEPTMQNAIESARRAAASEATILLSGESGTGKNVLARAIHRWSRRATGPFVTVNCTTLSDELLASELFGHVRGAFTGAWRDHPGRLAAAAGGTIFFDEIGELPADLQAKLLRFLEEHRFEPVGSVATVEVDARVVAATNRDLEREVAEGRFRQDLYYRLNVVALRIPPLRERRGDLAALTDHLLVGLAARHRRPSVRLHQSTREAIAGYSWPGNVRELANALERAVVLAPGDEILVDHLPDRLSAPAAAEAPAVALEDVERRHIEGVLADSATLEEAAARLGINPTTLWRKRRKFGLA